MKSLFLFLLLLPVFVRGQVIETIAGNGTPAYTGDGGMATNASLDYPCSVKYDNFGNLYIADWLNSVIRKVDHWGIITTVVGNGTSSYTGDGGQATAAGLNGPSDVAFDADGIMYVCDHDNNVIRKVDATGIITTIAGTGSFGYNGDNIPATSAMLFEQDGLIFDNVGNLIFTDEGNRRVRKINMRTGIITTIAGTGISGYSGDNGPATAAEFRGPLWGAMNSAGELYIPDYISKCLRKISIDGIITTVAGNGTLGDGGDGGPATAASIGECNGVAFDDTGNYYISSYSNCSIRKVNTAGIITTVAGNDTACGYGGDGGPAIDGKIKQSAFCTAVDHFGNVYIADEQNNRIRKITFNADSTAAISSVNKTPNTISIYPNPAQNEVTIKSTTAIESVEVVNMIGQVVASPFGKGSGQAASSKEVLLDIRSLPAGVYFVKVNGPDGYRDGGRFLKE